MEEACGKARGPLCRALAQRARAGTGERLLARDEDDPT